MHINRDDIDNISIGSAGRCELALLLGNILEEDMDQFIETWHMRWTELQAYILTPHYLNPFFMEGISGVLYQQLRLLFRKEMPSLISFE